MKINIEFENKSAKIEREIFELIKDQIRRQQKSIKIFPIVFAVILFLGFCQNNGKMPELYFYFLGIPFYIVALYSPISKSILLGKLFYNVEILNNNTIQFTTFGTLWRNEKIIVADLIDIKVDKNPLPKLLYKKYELNAIYIGEKKYYIFNKLLVESGIAN